MVKRFTDEDVRQALRTAIERAGSLRSWAAQAGVSSAHVSQVLIRDLPPGPVIAASLGFHEDGYRWVKR